MKQFDFSQSNEDKKTEFLRYEQRAKSLSKTKQLHSNFLGSKSQKLCLRSPYLKYEEIIKDLNLNINYKVLELACGTGEFSNLLIDINCDLKCTDISKESLIVLKKISK
jgi:cyclopropane fatty-acyl-phospholipid synthase-like methyltransferase